MQFLIQLYWCNFNKFERNGQKYEKINIEVKNLSDFMEKK